MDINTLNYILSKRGESSYANNLVTELNKMSPENLNLMLNRYLDKFLNVNMTERDMYLTKQPLLLAKALNAGHNIEFVDRLATLDYATAVREASIRVMQDKHVIHTEKARHEQGLQSSVFAQTANLDIEKLPIHGWKFHISAENIEDYHTLYSVVVPEFEALGISFKTVKPEEFEKQLRGDQTGKALTVYPSPAFDMSKLSPEARDFLLLPPHMQKSRAFEDQLDPGATQILSGSATKYVTPIGDTQIQGRIFARYGCFRSHNYISSQDGRIEFDPKKYRQHKPSFGIDDSPKGILYFYSGIESKFKETGDRKTYMQEYYTMAQNNDKSHSYMFLEINPKDAQRAQEILNANDPYTLSAVVHGIQGDNKVYMMVHQNALPNIGRITQDMMSYGCQQPVRPVWDMQTRNFEIPASQVQLAQAIMQEMARTYGQMNAHLLQTNDGKYVVQCDTTIKRVFDDYCQSNRLAYREMQEEKKNPLANFWEKITGKSLDNQMKDITFEPINRNEMYYSGEDR